MHAYWNLLSKQANGGTVYIWLFTVVSTVAYLPLAVWAFVTAGAISPIGWLFLIGSGVWQIVYFLVLQRAYSVGDLSLIYPLARGTGPALVVVIAIGLLGERPGWLAIGGTALIAISAILLTGGVRFGRGVAYGLATGAIIAGYTIWDAAAVSTLALPPILVQWVADAVRLAVLTPFMIGKPVAAEWRRTWRESIGVGLFSPLSYLLVLTALSFSPASYVAPAREISILFGVILGARLLAEGQPRRRLLAATGMVAGVVALTVG